MNENWNVYKISFEDGFEYVGITRYPVPDRIRRHIQRPVNAELSRRLTQRFPYVYRLLFTEIEDVTEAHRLESQEIRKLEKPINISGVDPEKAVHFGHPQTPENLKRRLYRVSKRKRDVYPPRKGRYVCSICRVKKAHTEFQNDRSRFNGLNSRCRLCNNARGKRERRQRRIDAGLAVIDQKRWTETDKETLKRETRKNEKTAAEIAEMLGRTPAAVNTMKQHLGISKNRPHTRWSSAEIQQLSDLVESGMKRKEIAKELRRTYASVWGMIRRILAKHNDKQ